MPTLTTGEIIDLPTLHSGQYADLKIDTGFVRVWASRCTIADGETEPIQLEELIDGRWIAIRAEPGGGREYSLELDGQLLNINLMTRYALNE